MKIRGWGKFKRILRIYALPFALSLAVYAFLLIPLVVVSRNEPGAFTEHASFIIASIAVIFAGISALIARKSLKKTEDSLELTRRAIRPFLSLGGDIEISEERDFVTLDFIIQNSGSVPASDVYWAIDFFGEEEKVTETNLSNKYGTADKEFEHALVFPNNVYYAEYIIYLQDKNDLELLKDIKAGITKCRVQLKYRGLERNHITIHTMRLVKQEWREKLTFEQIPPQKWE